MAAIARTDGDEVKHICRLDMKIFSCISGEMLSDEVIITQRQMEHSDRHEEVFSKYEQYIPKVLQEPDYIFEDSRPKDNPNTGIVTKRIMEADGRILQIVLRVKTSNDPKDYQNSIISCWAIGEKRLRSYLRNRKLLYIRDGL